jgi:uncharacterized membrane protein
MAEMESKKFAGILMVLIPIVFWLTQYLRFECYPGRCKIGMEWLILGFAIIVFGLVLLLNADEKKEQIVTENASSKKKM